MIPMVAVVGRPNVGKSTLVNRLTGRKVAIVDDLPGVTRDRNCASAFIHGREVTVVDTGGLDPATDDPIGRGITRQVQTAIEESDVVVCVLDGTAAPTEPDVQAVDLLRRSGKRVVFVANKIDRGDWTVDGDLHRLGLDRLVPLSALHGRGFSELESAIAGHLPPEQEEPAATFGGVPRIALVGRPNTGKSSLLNRLTGTARALVDPAPGTTRDPIDARIRYRGSDLVVVDTAGVRRRSRIAEAVEGVSVLRAIRALARADVAVLLCDASEGVTDQDQRLLGLGIDRRRAVVVGLNKWDLVRRAARRDAIGQARDELRFAPWAHIVPLSAKTGFGVPKIMDAVLRAAAEFERRISTGELNRFFSDVVERQPPPTSGGRAPRVFYMTQARAAPPVFVVVCSSPSHVRESYRRFVASQIRRRFGFESVPIVMTFRARRRS